MESCTLDIDHKYAGGINTAEASLSDHSYAVAAESPNAGDGLAAGHLGVSCGQCASCIVCTQCVVCDNNKVNQAMLREFGVAV